MGIKGLINKYLFEPLGYRCINLAKGQMRYIQDDLYSMYNCDFLLDPKFLRAYQRGEKGYQREEEAYAREVTGALWYWRLHVALWVASNAARLDGDFIECGVNRGFLSSAIMEHLNWNSLNKKFFLFDTFSGLDETLVSDEEKKLGRMQNVYSGTYQKAVENFKEFKNVVIVPGAVPGTLKDQDISSVSYLSLDINCEGPEIAAINHFWDKFTPGGMVLLDDYGHPMHSPQKVAFDRWALEKGMEILSLPTGQGLIIKNKNR